MEGLQLAGEYVLAAEDPSQAPVLGPARLAIRGAKIVDVELCSAADYPKRLQSWQSQYPRLHTFPNKLITPAFINAHTHLAMGLFRGLEERLPASQGNMVESLYFRVEAQLTADDVRAFARMGAYESLLNGVGLVWEHYYFGYELAQGIADTGLTAVVAPTLQDLNGPGQGHWEKEWDNSIRLHHDASLRAKGIYAAFGPHAPDTVSADLWRKIVCSSAREQMPLHAHLAQSFAEYRRIYEREGCSPAEWLRRLGVFAEACHSLLVHGIFTQEKDWQSLAHPRVTLGFCPFSTRIFAFPAPVLQWQQQGLSWTVGTDCAASNDSMNLQKELRYLCGIPWEQLSYNRHLHRFQKGDFGSLNRLEKRRLRLGKQAQSLHSPRALLEKVWETPGRMHPACKVGRLDKGYLANLAIWDFDDPSFWPDRGLHTLALGDTSHALHQMMCAGQWVSEAGNFHRGLVTSTDYREHVREARERLTALLKRCSL